MLFRILITELLKIGLTNYSTYVAHESLSQSNFSVFWQWELEQKWLCL